MQGTNVIETSIISGIMLIIYIIVGRGLGLDTWVVLTYPIVAAIIWAYNNIVTLRIYNDQHDYEKELHSRNWYLHVMNAFKLTYVALILSIVHHLANSDTYGQFFVFLKLDALYIVMFTVIILSVNKPYINNNGRLK